MPESTPAPVSVPSPEELIVQHLKENGQMTKWLADRVGVSKGHLQNILKGKGVWKERLSPEMRAKINAVLKTNY